MTIGVNVRNQILLTCALAASLLWASGGAAAEPAGKFQLETLRGKVVFLAQAVQRRTGVASVSEADERTLAIETAAGDVIPLIEDVRARAFRSDERLRAMQVELLVRRYDATPARQIIRIFEVKDGGRYEIDYWCDICSIVMYELKECECCQGPIELRRTKIP
jgi:hypothetical protein